MGDVCLNGGSNFWFLKKEGFFLYFLEFLGVDVKGNFKGFILGVLLLSVERRIFVTILNLE